jgi:hypothetical protein
MTNEDHPFSTIESAQEFLVLLAGAIDEALEAARAEHRACGADHLERRAEAWQLVAYTLTRLSSHVTSSRRLMNDLRTMRNLLEGRSTIGRARSSGARAPRPGKSGRSSGGEDVDE